MSELLGFGLRSGLALRLGRLVLPAAVRRILRQQCTRAAVEASAAAIYQSRFGAPHPSATSRPDGVNLIGYVRGQFSLGVALRAQADAIQSTGLPFTLCEYTQGCLSDHTDETWSRWITRTNPYAVNLIHINADQFPTAYLTLGPKFFAGRYNIGYWAWELSELPQTWLSALKLVDEVWVPSEFVRSAVVAATRVPVVRMPHVVEFPLPAGADRARFDLPRDKFLFLCMYDVLSMQERKNPEAAIAAFRAAFRSRRDVALVVKVNNGRHAPRAVAALRGIAEGMPQVIVLDQVLPITAVHALEACCDAFVSLHRSEGFGLCLAECMYLGKPVIGTNWSGNIDFMHEGNSCPVRYQLIRLERDIGPYRRGQQWADPDIHAAAWWMRRLVEHPSWAAKIGASARQTMLRHYSRSAVGGMMRARLATILRTDAPLPATPVDWAA